MPHVSRRTFLVAIGFLALPAIGARAEVVSAPAGHEPRRRRSTPHPTPRPGITGAKVLDARQLVSTPALIPLFDAVRKMPGVVDGIRCNCGCAESAGFYSLLSCYEGDGMARECTVCQGQGRLAARLHAAGRSLDEIRAAIDAKFG